MLAMPARGCAGISGSRNDGTVETGVGAVSASPADFSRMAVGCSLSRRCNARIFFRLSAIGAILPARPAGNALDRDSRTRVHRFVNEAQVRKKAMLDYLVLKEEAKKYIRYEKDRKNKIAYLTFARPDRLNATTIGMRQLYADLVFQANIDDDVKVLVIRGEGNNFGGGGDLPEQADMLSENAPEDTSLLPEFGINDPDVKYPPKSTYRFLHGLTDHYAKARAGNRPLQEFKKISILEAKGYCYGWHFYQAADVDLVVSSDDALFGHPAFRYAGWGPRLWTWVEMMGLRKFEEMLFTGRPFTAKEMYDCSFVNSVVPRDRLEAETEKYALACSRSRPTDVVTVQKTFLELYKQYRGEYLGSLLTGFVEGMLPMMKNDSLADVQLGDTVFKDKGLNNVVKDVDMLYPPEWRMAHSNRKKP
jgi:enoyl-CoA hydratase/carnithine racemase